MKILIAADSFKGSLTSLAVGKCIETGIRKVMADAVISVVPLADGGEGTVEAILAARGGERIEVEAMNPQGDYQPAWYGLLADGCAIIECASASGIAEANAEHVLSATSYGTGELIRNALDRGCRTIMLGLGGSGTNDAGLGILQALGCVFYDQDRIAVGSGVLGLSRIVAADFSGLHPGIKGCDLQLLCDVTNPLCGSDGATAVFGPQKGIQSDQVNDVDAVLSAFSSFIHQNGYPDCRDTPGSGAAGGMAFACLSVLGGRVQSGINTILEWVDMDGSMKTCDLVITGEGRLDHQTSFGKLPVGVAAYARKRGIACVAIAGSLGKGYPAVFDQGIQAVESTIYEPSSLEIALANAEQNTIDAAERLMRALTLFFK